MAPNSLSPSFVVINYHSAFGAHKMTLPTQQYNPGTPGTFDQWAGGTINAADMVNDMVDLIKAFFPADVEFDFFEIFLKATPTADSILSLSQTLAQVGTNATPGWTKATEAVLTMKSTNNGIFKMALLDVGTADSFDKVTFADLSGASLAWVSYLQGTAHGWAARDDGKPATFLQISNGLNKALRRKYNMN